MAGVGAVRPGPVTRSVAAFDTRIAKVRWLPKAAGSHRGPTGVQARPPGALDSPVAFVVADLQGPLVDGELERAAAWGRQLGTNCVDRVAGTAVTGRG